MIESSFDVDICIPCSKAMDVMTICIGFQSFDYIKVVRQCELF